MLTNSSVSLWWCIKKQRLVFLPMTSCSLSGAMDVVWAGRRLTPMVTRRSPAVTRSARLAAPSATYTSTRGCLLATQAQRYTHTHATP